ncbi:hypothetical protein ACF5W4_03465 [Bacillota bacterium Lsc_1132]
MLTLTSIDNLKATKEALEKLQKNYPTLFVKLLDMVYLTRAFHFKYQYMGCLLMDEYPGADKPNFVYDSVLRLYKREIQKLKDDENFHELTKIFTEFKSASYTKICLLVLGRSPESLVGTSYLV